MRSTERASDTEIQREYGNVPRPAALSRRVMLPAEKAQLRRARLNESLCAHGGTFRQQVRGSSRLQVSRPASNGSAAEGKALTAKRRGYRDVARRPALQQRTREMPRPSARHIVARRPVRLPKMSRRPEQHVVIVQRSRAHSVLNSKPEPARGVSVKHEGISSPLIRVA
jgi:hypothetical protein